MLHRLWNLYRLFEWQPICYKMPLLLQSTKQVNVYMKVSQAQAILIIVFDKVTILYEGRQIYFGRVESAKQYFINQGWQCLERQTTADFLTAVTGPYPSFLPNYRPHSPIPPRRFWGPCSCYSRWLRSSVATIPRTCGPSGWNGRPRAQVSQG